jgi:hypothetical protein
MEEEYYNDSLVWSYFVNGVAQNSGSGWADGSGTYVTAWTEVGVADQIGFHFKVHMDWRPWDQKGLLYPKATFQKYEFLDSDGTLFTEVFRGGAAEYGNLSGDWFIVPAEPTQPSLAMHSPLSENTSAAAVYSFMGIDGPTPSACMQYSWTHQAPNAAAPTQFSTSEHGAPGFTPDVFGEWQVCLTVTDCCGQTDTYCQVLTVTATRPTAAFSLSALGLTAQLTDKSIAGDAPIKFYAWRVLNSLGSQILTSEAQNPVFVLPAAGTYTFELTVTDENGLSDTATMTRAFGAGSTLPPYVDPLARYQGRVLVEQEDGSMVDLTRLLGENRVVSYRINDDVDQPVATATVELFLNTKNGSLAPLAIDSPANNLSGSYSPLVYAGRRILIQDDNTGTYDYALADWVPVFDGRIDKADPNSKNRMVLTCRDRAALLLDADIEESGEIYGTPEGQPVQEAMQAILDRWKGPGTWILYTPVDPQWGIREFALGEGKVLEALRTLATQRGYVVRWWRDDDAKVFRLMLFPRTPSRPRT